jgi:arylsulfatase A-like enzyme
LAVVAALSAGAGCGRAEDTAAPRPLQGAVLILLDTLRADHVSCYGYPRPTTPTLDTLARSGVRFTQVVSPAPWTLPSVAAMLAGRPPGHALGERLSSSIVERLRAAGLETAAFTEGGFVSRAFDFDRGFAEFEEEEGAVRLVRPGEPVEAPGPESGIAHTFSRAEQWLRRRRSERFFVLVHTYEPHTPYTHHDFSAGLRPGAVGTAFSLDMITRLRSGEITLDAGEIEYTKALYDGDILNADRHVGALLASLRAAGLADRTLVVVTSDHGEELADHYPANTGSHGHSLLDPLVMVPLIVADPTRRYPRQEVSAQVRLIDVLPTIADLLDVPVEPPVEGRSLVPLMEGGETGDRVAVMGNTRRGPPRMGVRAMGFKYVVTTGPDATTPPLSPAPPERQLYDLTADRAERHNLATERPALAAALHRLLDGVPEGQPVSENAIIEDGDAALRDRLRSLGYID